MPIEKIDCVDLHPVQRRGRGLSDVFGPAIETIASAVRVDAKSKLRGYNHVITERRKGCSHQFFVRERTIRLGSVKERDATLDGGTNDPDALLPLRWWPVVGAQPQAAESNG